ncbi:hypothetical protein LO762_28495 [Actinocorallia sp. API 0066]|uniref:hypothetical protein n=1 Tax=Actinocorallia sp. API 0066 TaxID=2896846 RepID=UPI001E5EE18A|nr:hypothetical protein [Actinocorallia sp. API 0066]MCD0453093.1 hypothetical protein [Actinocorallia sp. API 0066]
MAAGTVLALLVSTAALTLRARSQPGETDIPRTGGTALSTDRTISVRFPSGGVGEGTRVRVQTERDAPAPPDLVQPLALPFSITATKGTAHQGTVSYAYGDLPDGLTADRVVMMVYDEKARTWQFLETGVRDGRVIATWPHFSLGFIGFLDGAFTAAGWAWDKVRAKAGVQVRNLATVSGKVGEGLVGLVGGTVHSVKCRKTKADFAYLTTNINGGHMSRPPLTACAEPPDKDSEYVLRIGNRYPYPYLLKLPAGVRLDWRDLDLGGTDLLDLAVQYVQSLRDLALVPGGGEVALRVSPDADHVFRVTADAESLTVAVKMISLAVIAPAAGRSAAVAAFQAEMKALDTALSTARRAGSTKFTLADFAEAVGWHSRAHRLERAARNSTLATSIEAFFEIVNGVDCVLRLGKKAFQEDAHGTDGIHRLASWAAAAGPQCLQTALARFLKATEAPANSLLSPRAQTRKGVALAKEIVGVVQDLPLVVSSLEVRVIERLSLGRFDYKRAALTISRGEGTYPVGRLLRDNAIWKVTFDRFKIADGKLTAYYVWHNKSRQPQTTRCHARGVVSTFIRLPSGSSIPPASVQCPGTGQTVITLIPGGGSRTDWSAWDVTEHKGRPFDLLWFDQVVGGLIIPPF